MPRGSPNRLIPTVFRLESRDVPTVISPWAFGGAGLLHNQTIHVAATGGGGGGFGVGTPNEVPTPAELARERFVDRFTRIQVGLGAPNSSDQARQFLYAGSGSGNQSIAARLVMRLFTPVDPNGQVTGIAALRDRSIATSGTALVINLTGSTADLDAQGRPTRLNWTVDSNTSGGADTGAIGSGTVVITYGPNPHRPHAPGINAGSANAVFSGLVRTNQGVTNITQYENGHF
jgi:hypothetical protein